MRRTLEGIYRRHRQGLYALALSVTRQPEQAEDAIHEAFVRLCRSRRKAEGDVTAYVFAAVRNAAIDQLRKRTRRAAPVSIFADAAVDGSPTPLGAAESDERARLLRDALEDLSPPQRETIVMKIYGGLTFEQIAKAFGEPLSTVSSRYRRGLDRLRESVEALV